MREKILVYNTCISLFLTGDIQSTKWEFSCHEFRNRTQSQVCNTWYCLYAAITEKLSFAQAVEVNVNESSLDGVLKLGIGFNSEEHAYEFYNSYATQVGLNVKKDYVNRSKVGGVVASRRFTCFREGFRQKEKRGTNVKRPRKDIGIGCLAQLIISLQLDEKYHITHFEKKHNHGLVAVCRVHTLRSHKRLATILFDDSIVH